MASKGNHTRADDALRVALMLASVVALIVAGCGGGDGAKPAFSGGAPGSPAATATATDSPTATPAPTLAPESPEALATAANLLREGRLEEAATGYEAIVARARDPEVKASAALGASVARFQSGDPGSSVTLLKQAVSAAPAGTITARRSAYLLGIRLLDSNAYTAAGDALRGEAESPTADALQPYVVLAYARALSAAEDPGAGAAWDRLAALPNLAAGFDETIARERASAARSAGDEASLAKWLGRVVELSGDASARYELASVAKRLGDEATFISQLRAIVNGASGSKSAYPALEALKAAGKSVDAGQEGLVQYRRGAYAEAQEVLEAAVKEPGLSAEALAFREFYLGAAYEDGGQAALAVQWYDAAAATGANSPYVHRAKYWAARVTEGVGDERSAASRYRELAANGPGGEFSSEAAFRAGYALLQADDAAGAVEAWDGLAAGLDARLLYWKGRAEEQLGRGEQAKADFAAAYGADPLGFYGTEAGRRIGARPALDVSYRQRTLSAAIDWEGIATWLNAIVPGAMPGGPATAAGDLLAVGLREEAATALDEAAVGAGPWRLLELAREARGLGMVDVAAQLAARLQSAVAVPWQSVPRDVLRLAYPVDYVAQVQSEAKEYGLDPLFFAAMVRQESYWDPAAGSHAGALGLTQVIPPTGESIAGALGMQNFVADDLFRPAVSLKFGAFYLGGQLGQYRSPYLALAAYNAGPGNASRWAERAGANADGPTTAEVIDIPETHDYVERIMEHYARYLAAYAGS